MDLNWFIVSNDLNNIDTYFVKFVFSKIINFSETNF